MEPVKEFLCSYWEARLEEKRLRRRAAELTSQCEKMTARYGYSPGGGGGGANSVWDALVEAKDRVDEKLKFYLKREAEVEEFLNSLRTPLYRQILRYRYLEKLKWETIGTMLDYHPDHVRQDLHKYALREARAKWKEREEQNV
jgi:DNA-directed RNA polymerase specialized sigma24 family protein